MASAEEAACPICLGYFAAHECKETFKIQRKRIANVFDQVQQFLEKEKYRHLSNLEEEEKRTIQETREAEAISDDAQSMDRNQIRDLDSKCQQLDVERQRKDVESILSRAVKMKCQHPDSENGKDKVKKTEKNEIGAEEEKEVADVEEEDEDEYEEQLDVEKEQDLVLTIIKLLEWRWACNYSCDVTLDPDTAHLWLDLSEDGKSVRHGDRGHDLPKMPERYSPELNVLGKERLSSGRHYWEVEVGEKTWWKLGVCYDNVRRKGFIDHSPKSGYWVVQRRDGEYKAFNTPVIPQSPLQVVGLFLDYEAGQILVYNAHDRSLLFTFAGISFERPLLPFFCPGHRDGGKNVRALRILPETEQE